MPKGIAMHRLKPDQGGRDGDEAMEQSLLDHHGNSSGIGFFREDTDTMNSSYGRSSQVSADNSSARNDSSGFQTLESASPSLGHVGYNVGSVDGTDEDARSDLDEITSQYTIGAAGAQPLLKLPSVEDARERSGSYDSVGHDKSLTTASLRSVTVNIVNTVVGGGVLLLPYAMFLDGDVLGPLLILAVAILAERSVNMLLYSAEHTDSLVYSEIGRKLGGRVLCWIVDIAILLQNYGLCVSYVVLIGQLLPSVFHDWFGLKQSTASRDVTLTLLSVFVFFPLCCLRTLDKLRYTSFVALGCVVSFVVFVTSFGIWSLADKNFRPGDKDGQEDLVFARNDFIDFLKSIPLIFFSFVAHNNILLLYSELKRRSKPDRQSKFVTKRSKHLTAVRIALSTCAILYVFQGVFGYIMFRGDATGNILMHFDASNDPFKKKTFKVLFPTFKLIYVLVLIFSFPVMAYGLRRSIHTFFWRTEKEPSTRTRISQAALLVIASASLGIAAGTKVNVVFGLTGSVAASSVMFVLPSLFFILLRHQRNSPEDFPGDYVLAVFTLAVGLFVCVGSTFATVYKIK